MHGEILTRPAGNRFLAVTNGKRQPKGLFAKRAVIRGGEETKC